MTAMQLNDYQKQTLTTAIYKEAGTGSVQELSYLSLGLVNEAGEVAGKVKKLIRDGVFDEKAFADELGDVFWYLVRCCDAINLPAEACLVMNYKKLQDRKERGVLSGSGDTR